MRGPKFPFWMTVMPIRSGFPCGASWFVAVAAVLLSWQPSPSPAAELCPVIRAADAAAEAKIVAALKDDARLEFIETPLNQVATFLQDQHDIPIKLDHRALDDVGVGVDTPITAELKGVSLHAALLHMLGQLDLTYSIQNEVLLITTPEVAESRPEVRVYAVSALLPDGADAAALVGMLQAALQAELNSAEPAHGFGANCPGMPGGGAGDMGMMGGGMPGGMGGGMGDVPATEYPASLPRIIPAKRLLIVRHTSAGQHEVRQLLEALAVASQSAAVGGESSQPASAPAAAKR